MVPFNFPVGKTRGGDHDALACLSYSHFFFFYTTTNMTNRLPRADGITSLVLFNAEKIPHRIVALGLETNYFNSPFVLASLTCSTVSISVSA